MSQVKEIDQALVEHALQENREYVDNLLEQYQEVRESRPRPVLCFLGYGRAGKDAAAEFLGNSLGLPYGGSTSLVAAPLVASALGLPVEEAFASRHENRMFWFHFLNAVRERDQCLLAKLLLAQSAFVVGLRSKTEVESCVREGVVDTTIWVRNPRVPVDPTVEFEESDCHVTLVNDKSLETYHSKLLCFAKMCGLKKGI